MKLIVTRRVACGHAAMMLIPNNRRPQDYVLHDEELVADVSIIGSPEAFAALQPYLRTIAVLNDELCECAGQEE